MEPASAEPRLSSALHMRPTNSSNLENSLSLNFNEKKVVKLGICAMKKKVESKPMREILARLACP